MHRERPVIISIYLSLSQQFQLLFSTCSMFVWAIFHFCLFCRHYGQRNTQEDCCIWWCWSEASLWNFIFQLVISSKYLNSFLFWIFQTYWLNDGLLVHAIDYYAWLVFYTLLKNSCNEFTFETQQMSCG
jgi:hypothetical protein